MLIGITLTDITACMTVCVYRRHVRRINNAATITSVISCAAFVKKSCYAICWKKNKTAELENQITHKFDSACFCTNWWKFHEKKETGCTIFLESKHVFIRKAVPGMNNFSKWFIFEWQKLLPWTKFAVKTEKIDHFTREWSWTGERTIEIFMTQWPFAWTSQ